MNKIVLIDAKNLCYRAHYAFRDLKTLKGTRTSILHGFPSLMIDLQRFIGKADYIVCWDGIPPFPDAGPFVQNWRKLLWPQYKENRDPKNPEVEAAVAQMPKLAEFFSILGYLQLGVGGLEADDVIGLVASGLAAREKVEKVWIYSNDRDLYQLVGGKISVVGPTGKGGVEELKAKHVGMKLGVKPDRVAALKALAGDTSDNYKPIKGLGDVNARRMLEGGVMPWLDTFEEHPPEVQDTYRAKLADAWPLIRRCYDLALIPTRPDDLRIRAFQADAEAALLKARKERTRRMSASDLDKCVKRYIQFCNRYELGSLVGRRRAFFEFVVPI